MDGTLIEAWASMKSFNPREQPSEGDDDDSGSTPGKEGRWKASGRNAECDLRGDKGANATHASVTDPDVKLFEKARGQEERPSQTAQWRTARHLAGGRLTTRSQMRFLSCHATRSSSAHSHGQLVPPTRQRL